MSDDILFKHYNARHVPNDVNVVSLRYSATLSPGLIGSVRAWHDRMHDTIDEDTFDHEHLEPGDA